MSDCNELKCCRSRGDVLLCKPRHVRSLNFGHSILELDTVRCSVPNGVLVIDEKVARIPCTEKGDYVRKWLETHENGRCHPSQFLGTSPTTTSQRSPILGNSRKRSRRKICRNRNATTKRPNNADHQESVGYSANCTTRSKPHCGYKEKNKEWESTSETQHTPPGREKVAIDETSPVLGTHCVFKKKRRKLQYGAKASISPECSKLYDYKITDINTKSITEPDDNRNNLKEMPAEQDKLKENLDTKSRTFIFSTEVKESPEKSQRSIETFSSSTQERLSFADSSSNNIDKNDSKIETDTSNNSKDEECDKLTSTSDSSNNLSNCIEDVDTQETTKTSQFSANKYLIPSRQPLTSLQLTIDDLDETYCLEAEIMQDQSTHLSTRISEVQSLNKTTQKTGSKSTQTDAIISTITTPSKKSPNRNVYAHLLDSGKKRRRPKK